MYNTFKVSERIIWQLFSFYNEQWCGQTNDIFDLLWIWLCVPSALNICSVCTTHLKSQEELFDCFFHFIMNSDVGKPMIFFDLLWIWLCVPSQSPPSKMQFSLLFTSSHISSPYHSGIHSSIFVLAWLQSYDDFRVYKTAKFYIWTASLPRFVNC